MGLGRRLNSRACGPGPRARAKGAVVPAAGPDPEAAHRLQSPVPGPALLGSLQAAPAPRLSEMQAPGVGLECMCPCL